MSERHPREEAIFEGALQLPPEQREAYLKAENMHYDWVLRVEWETQAQDGKLHVAE